MRQTFEIYQARFSESGIYIFAPNNKSRPLKLRLVHSVISHGSLMHAVSLFYRSAYKKAHLIEQKFVLEMKGGMQDTL